VERGGAEWSRGCARRIGGPTNTSIGEGPVPSTAIKVDYFLSYFPPFSMKLGQTSSQDTYKRRLLRPYFSNIARLLMISDIQFPGGTPSGGRVRLSKHHYGAYLNSKGLPELRESPNCQITAFHTEIGFAAHYWT
jgi:hypothetical protein